ncbi:MAG: radical SAM family heme chaperone HemW [Bacteroidales bacterium]|nr:radical SAM family heme chaperone HemW [Bacteroidales bacterium]
MSGLYVHIPFCSSKCAYCGFYSIPSLKRKADFLEALKQEIAARKGDLHGEKVGTVYFGGGTPSLLKEEEVETILKILHDHFEIDPEAEVTLEANPDTLSLDYLVGLRSIGVNRLSIGIQSFFDNDLKYLSRRHDAQHAQDCLLWARAAGFDNVTIDLIYGLPTSDADQWNRNLDRFFATGFPHLSAYALTLEPNAILTKQIEMGKVLPVNEDDAVRDYEILCQKMAQHGFQHYEISNFCKPGMHSRHNTSYWFGVPYAGFGPSAHSYYGVSRQWNDSSLERYLEQPRQGLPVGNSGLRDETPGYGRVEKEILTPEQRYDEYVMLRLRTMWGVDLSAMKQALGARFSTYCEKNAQPLIEQGRLSRKGDVLYLTDQQMLFADGIAEALFW